tara:strand:- start:1179 stop:3323 length:2145 start_codon:yes stop_codon:yes gene_type:complete
MAVKKEIKSQLAKLLATEDLVVEHKHVQTACFNVHTRVLTLPMWEKASNTVYDLLVGHEVGHALFTPDEDWLEKVAVPPQFVNVVEDARIEKLMKRKYAGLAKTFFNGYRELNDQDFFSISDESIANFNLADRANLYFKIGNFVNVHFDEFDESLIIKKISDVETFDDALRVAEELYLHCKKEKEEKVDDITPPPEIGGESETPANELVEDSGESSEKGETEGAGDDNQPISSGDQPATAPLSDDPEVQTADALQENLQDLVGSDTSYENVYVEIPQVDLKYIIAKNDDVHKEIDLWFNHQQNNIGSDFNIFGKVDDEFIGFKRSAQKEVNYLVKEFECRKAADSYARATTARTGVLDTTKLHTYKYNEDLFKKVTTLADGKNHGLVFVLDWSGSMSKVMLDTIKQLYNLIWFCKKVSIPFEVYAFTNEWKKPEIDYEKGEVIKPADWTLSYEAKENLLVVQEQFSMMNLLSSKTNSKQLENQMINIFRIAKSFCDYYCSHYSVPTRLGLSGTPLNEAFVCLHQILPKFQKENKLQKVQCITLTDGEANHLARHVMVKRHWENEPYMGTSQLPGGITFLRDRKIGRTYQVPYGWHGFSDLLLQNLRDNFPSVNFIGIRVLEGRDCNNFIKLYYDLSTKEYPKVLSDWKKLRSFTIKNSGYHAYFGLSATSLSQEAEFEVDEGATKAKIKSAFIKSLKTKKLNKKVLGEFISLIA